MVNFSIILKKISDVYQLKNLIFYYLVNFSIWDLNYTKKDIWYFVSDLHLPLIYGVVNGTKKIFLLWEILQVPLICSVVNG